MYAVGRNYRMSEEDEFTEGFKQSVYHIFNPLLPFRKCRRIHTRTNNTRIDTKLDWIKLFP